MARDITVTIGQVVGDNFQPVTTKTQLNLRLVSDTGTVAYNQGSHLGDGVYPFSNVADGDYYLYDNATRLTKFGTIQVGDVNAVKKTGNEIIAGVKTFSGQPVMSAGIKTNSISENTTANGVTIDGINLKDDLNTSNIVTKDGTQDISGLKIFQTYPQIDDGIGTDPSGYQIPFTSYIQSLITAIVGYEQGKRIIRVNPNGTVKAGEQYTSIASAVAYAYSQTPSVTKTFNIIIESTAVGYEYITAEVGSFKNYVNLICANPNIKVLVAGTNIISKTDCLGGEWIFGGGNSSPGSSSPRTLEYVTFKSCKVNKYRNMTFKGGGLHNVVDKSSGSYNTTFDKDSNNEFPLFLGNVIFRTEPIYTDKDTWQTQPIAEVRTDLVMPDDPTMEA